MGWTVARRSDIRPRRVRARRVDAQGVSPLRSFPIKNFPSVVPSTLSTLVRPATPCSMLRLVTVRYRRSLSSWRGRQQWRSRRMDIIPVRVGIASSPMDSHPSAPLRRMDGRLLLVVLLRAGATSPEVRRNRLVARPERSCGPRWSRRRAWRGARRRRRDAFVINRRARRRHRGPGDFTRGFHLHGHALAAGFVSRQWFAAARSRCPGSAGHRQHRRP